MPHFRKLLHTGYFAAEDFLDNNFQPRPCKLTIASVSEEAPPSGGKKCKPCFTFQGTDKKMLVANGEVKKLAKMLRRANTDDWIGAQVTVSCAPKKFAGQDVLGMVFTDAQLPATAKKEEPDATE